MEILTKGDKNEKIRGGGFGCDVLLDSCFC